MSLIQTVIPPDALHHCTAGRLERKLAATAKEARDRLWPLPSPITGRGQATDAVTLPTLPKAKPDAPKASCMDLGVSYTPTVSVSYSFHFCPIDLLLPCKTVSMHDLARILCQREGITEAQLRGPQRTGHICEVRQIFCYLNHCFGRKTAKQIGMFLGDRDHTTIIHSRDKVLRRRQEPEFAKRIAKYEKLFTQFTKHQPD